MTARKKRRGDNEGKVGEKSAARARDEASSWLREGIPKCLSIPVPIRMEEQNEKKRKQHKEKGGFKEAKTQ